MQITQGSKQARMGEEKEAAETDWMWAKGEEAQPPGCRLECCNGEEHRISNSILTHGYWKSPSEALAGRAR